MTEKNASPIESIRRVDEITVDVRDQLESSLSVFGVSVDVVDVERPAALIQAIGQVGEEPPTSVLRELTTAVGFLEGYLRLREFLLGTGYETARERDSSLLASDYLHAAAYRALEESTLPPERTVACYRHLITGSTALAERLHTDAQDPPDERPGPRATLVGTAGALGATAAGLEADVADAARTYGESVAAAADLAAERGDVDSLTGALTDTSEPRSADDPLEAMPDGPGRECLETAAWALDE